MKKTKYLLIAFAIFVVVYFATAESSHKRAARAWFANNNIDIQHLKSLSKSQRAKIATSLTYKFCEAGISEYDDVNDVYDKCRALCSGFAYFYKGLVEVLGLEARYVHLYNIPGQGNHAAVEVRTENDTWGLVDPTFGLFFTDTGEWSGAILTLQDIVTKIPQNDLEKHIIQSNKTFAYTPSVKLSELFGGAFKGVGISLSSYQTSEVISRLDPNEIIVLEIPITVKDKLTQIGNFSGANWDDLAKGWLDYTNNMLRDDDLKNDISYRAALLENREEKKAAILSLHALIPGQHYKVRLRIANQRGSQKLQVSSFGHGFYSSQNLFVINKGVSTLEFNLRARFESGSLFLRNMKPKGRLGVFAIQIIPISGPINTFQTQHFPSDK